MLHVIVPSAVRVSPEMEVDFGPVPPCLVPLAGSVAAEKIIEQYDANAHFYFAINDRKELVYEHFEFFPNDRVHLVDVGNTISIGHTIERVAAIHPEIERSPLVINFADTIIEDNRLSQSSGNFMAIADTIESERWTLIKIEHGKITDLVDKKFLLDAEDRKTLLGIWGIADSKQFFDVLRSTNPSSNRNSFYDSIVRHFNNLSTPPLYLQCEEFVDCGHADNYYAARRKLINARFFNVLTVDDRSGTIRKTSENKEKLIDEIRWIQSIPKELKPYTPTVFDYSKNPLDPFIEMEFYSYPSLDEAFVSARFDFDTWEKLFEKLFEIIERAGKYRVVEDTLEHDLADMYLKKTRDRLALVDLRSLKGTVHINGIPSPGLDGVRARLESSLQRVGALSSTEFQVIHGDLCLGNILYDPRHGLVKLIDPRGRFGRFDIYGDVYYDLAKLSHSVLGMYDFIVSGRSRVCKSDDNLFDLKFKSSEYHATVGKIFVKHLESRGFDLDRVRLIESLLFLSMIPLHQDHPERQLAMGLQGLKLFAEFGESA